MAGAVAFLALLLGATSCGSDTVHVQRFAVSAGAHTTCRQFLAALPDEVAGQTRRHLTGSTYAAAWGDPAIVLRCGVPLPKDFAIAPCITRNGIGWSIPQEQADDQTSAVVMTLAFHSPVVQVSLPAHYRPNGPSQVMADLDRAVRGQTTANGRCS
jgi:hypothetical protein